MIEICCNTTEVTRLSTAFKLAAKVEQIVISKITRSEILPDGS